MSIGRIIADAGWETIASIDDGSGYDWRVLEVYYSPSARRFFWLADAGCSCNCFGDAVSSVEDFENGSREDALREVAAFIDPQHADHDGAVLAIKAVKVDR